MVEPEPNQSRCKSWFFFITSGIGLFAGLAGFLAFTFTFNNYQAGSLALFSALLSTLCLHLHMLDYYGLLAAWYTPAILRRITVFAAVILLAALALMGWYLSQVISKHQGFYPIETSNPARAVMSFLNVKWAVSLLVLSVSFRRRLVHGAFTYHSLAEPQSITGDADA